MQDGPPRSWWRIFPYNKSVARTGLASGLYLRVVACPPAGQRPGCVGRASPDPASWSAGQATGPIITRPGQLVDRAGQCLLALVGASRHHDSTPRLPTTPAGAAHSPSTQAPAAGYGPLSLQNKPEYRPTLWICSKVKTSNHFHTRECILKA